MAATVTQLLLLLDYAKNALQAHHNFNLAEVHIDDYLKKCKGTFANARAKKSVLNALEKRDSDLLLAVIDSEIERLSVLKIKALREKIVNR